jgi:Sulfotransferase domain
LPLRVIGAGFGRTGTDSMREALNLLGFGPCHHMREVTENPLMKERWRAFIVTGEADWPALFEGYAACVDWPSAHYWRELIETYPEAKVLLTWRPAEAWWTSFESTILRFVENPDDPDSVGAQVVGKALGPGKITRDKAIATYEANVAAVKAAVPPDRLLIHAVGDGWVPLCAHLGVPVPDVPYPHRNTTAEMQARFAKQQQQ